MGTKKHALAASLGAVAGELALEFSPQSAALAAIAAGGAVLKKDAIQTGWQKARQAFTTAKNWTINIFHREVKPRAKQLGAACDPRDPTNNAHIGAAIGAAATAVVTRLAEMDSNTQLLVAGGTLLGGAAGTYLNDKRIAKGLESTINKLESDPKNEKSAKTKGQETGSKGFLGTLLDTSGTVPATAKGRTKKTTNKRS